MGLRASPEDGILRRREPRVRPSEHVRDRGRWLRAQEDLRRGLHAADLRSDRRVRRLRRGEALGGQESACPLLCGPRADGDNARGVPHPPRDVLGGRDSRDPGARRGGIRHDAGRDRTGAGRDPASIFATHPGLVIRGIHFSSRSSSPFHRYFFCFRFLWSPFCNRYPIKRGNPIVASTRLCAIFASLWNLPQDCLSSNVQPLRPPHCGTSTVIWAAYMWGFSGYPMTSWITSTCEM